MKCAHCEREFTPAPSLTSRNAVCPHCGASNTVAASAANTIPPSTRGAPRRPQPKGDPKTLIGTTLGNGAYRIEAHLGGGAMGEVFRATHLSLGRQVAIKVLAPSLASDTDFLNRFEIEARSLAALTHQHIVRVYDFRQDAERSYLVMELVGQPGEPTRSLGEEITVDGLGFERARRLVLDALDALDHAHKARIIHRDIKPANLLVDADGRLKVADFGLAKSQSVESTVRMTQAGATMGTFGYMAPEQAADASAADARSDLYSVGVVFYELLMGRRPEFQHLINPDRFGWPGQQREDVPPETDQVIRKALQPDPSDRYQTAGEMAEAVRSLPAAGSRVGIEDQETKHDAGVHAPRSIAPAPRRPNRTPKVVAGLAALAVMVVIAVIWGPPLAKAIILPSGVSPKPAPITSGGEAKPSQGGAGESKGGVADAAQGDTTTTTTAKSIHDAARGSAAELGEFIKANPGAIDERGSGGLTPLHVAAAGGRLDVLQALINAGAKVDAVDDDGRTPLHHAASVQWAEGSSSPAIIAALVSAGANVNAADKSGLTPLHMAARVANQAAVDTLLKHRADRWARDAAGNLPADLVPAGHPDAIHRALRAGSLIKAAAEGDVAAVQAAAGSGYGDLGEVDAAGNTALHLTIAGGHTQAALALLDRPISVAAKNDAGIPALRLLLESSVYGSPGRRPELLRLAGKLIERGAKADWRDAKGDTPLHARCAAGDVELAKALIPGSDVTQTNAAGLTPFCLVVMSTLPEPTRAELIDALVAARSPMDCAFDKNETLLHKSARSGDVKVLEAVLRNGSVDINSRNDAGESALLVAIRAKQIAAARLLINAGTRLTDADNRGNSSLHAVAEIGSLELAEALLDRTKRLEDKNADGKTPAEVARAAGHNAVADLLTPAKSPAVNPSTFEQVGTWAGSGTLPDGRTVSVVLTIDASQTPSNPGSLAVGGAAAVTATIQWQRTTGTMKMQLAERVALDDRASGSSEMSGAVELISADSFAWKPNAATVTITFRRR